MLDTDPRVMGKVVWAVTMKTHVYEYRCVQ